MSVTVWFDKERVLSAVRQGMDLLLQIDAATTILYETVDGEGNLALAVLSVLAVPEGDMALLVDRPGMESIATLPSPLLPSGGDRSAAVRTFRLHPPLPPEGAAAPAGESS